MRRVDVSRLADARWVAAGLGLALLGCTGSAADHDAASSPRADEAVAPADRPEGTLIGTVGTVRVRRSGQTRWVPVGRGEPLRAGDAVQTLAASAAVLRFPGAQAWTELDEHTTVLVPEATPQVVRVRHQRGRLVARLDPGQAASLAIELPPGELTLERPTTSEGAPTEARIDVRADRTEVAMSGGAGVLARRGGDDAPHRIPPGHYGVFDERGEVLEGGEDGPRPTLRLPRAGATVRTRGEVSLEWSAVPGAAAYLVEISGRDEGASLVARTGETSATVRLSAGEQRWSVRGLRPTGVPYPASAPETFAVVLDREGPPLELTSPPESAVVSKAAVAVSGRSEPGARVTLDGEPVMTSDDGSFTTSRSLRPGLTMLVVRAADDLGNTRTITRTVVRR